MHLPVFLYFYTPVFYIFLTNAAKEFPGPGQYSFIVLYCITIDKFTIGSDIFPAQTPGQTLG